MTRQGDLLTTFFVLFCVVGAPLIFVTSIAYLWSGNIFGMNLHPVLLMLERFKERVMLDIYLVGISVVSIKVQDYIFLQPGVGLSAFIALMILSILTLSHLNVEQLWDHLYPQGPARRPDGKLRVCLGCHSAGYPNVHGRCPRCHIPLRQRGNQSIQKCWVVLLVSIVPLLSANLLSISIIYVNGGRQEDTVLSGIMPLVDSNIDVAAAVFTANMLAPFTKVIVMFTLLFSIHFNCE